MGFYAYIIPPGIILSNIDLSKKYFIIDKINIENIKLDNKENINVDVIVNIYESYEERLLRKPLLSQLFFSLNDILDKEFSENIWSKCYIKIKELFYERNKKCLIETLTLRELEKNPITDNIIIDPLTGMETYIIPSNDPEIIVDIPNEFQYLLKIDDDFNDF
tara:strand:+ start:2840 stop:3328 length:489 start_codon:yes stop_codon:yes gene_type:complete